MQRHDVASTLRRRCIDVMCLLGMVMSLFFFIMYRPFSQAAFYIIFSVSKNVNKQQRITPNSHYDIQIVFVQFQSLQRETNKRLRLSSFAIMAIYKTAIYKLPFLSRRCHEKV